MSLFKLSNADSFRRFLRRGFFALLVLPAAFLVMGCGNNTPSGLWVTGAWAPLDGTWDATNIPGIGDSFAFDTAAQTFERGFGPWDGTISGIQLFDVNGSAGVVFVRFGEDRPVNWIWVGPGDGDFDPVPVEGNYTAIAFRTAAGGFQLAELADENWEMPTTDTLAQARARFTVDTVDGYVSWGGVPVYARIE
jgi:hypothetical protein